MQQKFESKFLQTLEIKKFETENGPGKLDHTQKSLVYAEKLTKVNDSKQKSVDLQQIKAEEVKV